MFHSFIYTNIIPVFNAPKVTCKVHRGILTPMMHYQTPDANAVKRQSMKIMFSYVVAPTVSLFSFSISSPTLVLLYFHVYSPCFPFSDPPTSSLCLSVLPLHSHIKLDVIANFIRSMSHSVACNKLMRLLQSHSL